MTTPQPTGLRPDIEEAELRFEVLDYHREEWSMQNPDVPIDYSYAGDIEFGRQWLADWRSRLPDD